MEILSYIDSFGTMNTNETHLAKSLLSHYESELRLTYSYLPNSNSEIEKQLLLFYSNKEKHQYLSDEYKKCLSELREAKLPEEVTVEYLISSKAKLIEKEIHKIVQATPNAFEDTAHELVFRSFITCCNDLNSEIIDLEKKINDAASVDSKYIASLICDIEESVDLPLAELNNSISKYSKNEYVDQEIIINSDTLGSIFERIKPELLNRLENNFPASSHNNLYIKADLSVRSEKVVDNRRINLEGFLNLISDIKKYSQEQLENLQTKKEYTILNSFLNSSADLSALMLIKKRDGFLATLENITDNTEASQKEDIRFLKAATGYSSEFFEDLGARLYRAGYIDKQVTEVQFAKVFSGENVKKKINWVGPRAKAPMLYLMYLLFEKYKIVEYPPQPFPRLVNSFLLDNEIIERDTNAHDVLRSSYKKIAKGKYPGKDTRAAIDKIVQSTLASYK